MSKKGGKKDGLSSKMGSFGPALCLYLLSSCYQERREDNKSSHCLLYSLVMCSGAIFLLVVVFVSVFVVSSVILYR